MNESQREELAQILAEVRGLELRSRRVVHDVVTGGYESAFRGAGMDSTTGVEQWLTER